MLHRFYKSMWKSSLLRIYILYRHVHLVGNVLTLDLFSVSHCLVLEPGRRPFSPLRLRKTLRLCYRKQLYFILVNFVIIYCNSSAKVSNSNYVLVKYVYLSYSNKTNSRKQHHYLLQIWLQQTWIYWLLSSRLSCISSQNILATVKPSQLYQ